jgi:hypothetical protein
MLKMMSNWGVFSVKKDSVFLSKLHHVALSSSTLKDFSALSQSYDRTAFIISTFLPCKKERKKI